MILDTLNDTIVDDEVGKVGVNVNNLTFNLMIDGIYTNKLHSVIRELATNARDSTIEAGKGKLIIRVNTLEHSTRISIKDTGLGLSEEDAKKYLCNLNASSKRTSNQAVGCLGIGSKSAFSLVPHYQYICVKDGIETQVELFRVEKETPRFLTLSQPTDKEDSVECILEIENKSFVQKYETPLHTMLVAIVSELCLFDIPIELYVNDSENEYSKYFPKVELYNSFYLVSYERLTDLNSSVLRYIDRYKKISSGVVGYNFAINGTVKHGNLGNYSLIIRTELGELSFDSSRENIENTPENSQKISRIIDTFLTENFLLIEHLKIVNQFFSSTIILDPYHIVSDGDRVSLERCFRLVLSFLQNFQENRSILVVFSLLLQYTDTPYVPRIGSLYNVSSLFNNLFSFERYTSGNGDLQLIGSIINRLIHKANHSASVYKNAMTVMKRTGDLILITTNEKINESLRASEVEHTILHHYMRKEGFDDELLQRCFGLLVEFLNSQGIPTKHFNRLKTLLDDEETAYLYEKIKPISRPSRTSDVVTNPHGLVLRVSYKFPHYRGITKVAQESTSVKIVDDLKRYAAGWFRPSLVYVSRELVSSDDQVGEFITSNRDVITVFEYQQDMPVEAMDGILKAINEFATVIRMGVPEAIPEDKREKYKSAYIVSQMTKIIKDRRQVFMDRLQPFNTATWIIDSYQLLRFPDNVQSYERLFSVVYPRESVSSCVSHFVMVDAVAQHILGSEMQELKELASSLVPTYDQDKYISIVKEIL